MILKRKNKKDKIFSEYPCSVYLHNALRFITNNKPDVAYEDICHALMKAGDELSDEEKRILKEIQANKRSEENGRMY